MKEKKITKRALSLATILVLGITGCSDSDSSDANKSDAITNSGVAIDGLLSGATVCIDVNLNGVCNADEDNTVTDQDGEYELVSTQTGPLVLIGGTDIGTGLPFTGILKAPEGSSVITPLTSAIQALIENGKTQEEAESLVKTALGIPSDIDLTNFDPLQEISGENAQAAKIVLEKQAQLQTLIHGGATLLANAKEGVSVSQTMSQMFNELVKEFEGATQELEITTDMLKKATNASAQKMFNDDAIEQIVEDSVEEVSDDIVNQANETAKKIEESETKDATDIFNNGMKAANSELEDTIEVIVNKTIDESKKPTEEETEEETEEDVADEEPTPTVTPTQTPAVEVSYLDKVTSSGSILPYTVLDNTIDDGKNPGTNMEIRNGGFGSAAAVDPENNNRFYALTDRGPNATYTGVDGKGKMFPTPEYTPRIGHFEIQSDGSVKKLKEILLQDRDGNNITGLPNSSALGGTGETPYDKDGNTIKNPDNSIKTDDYGLDSEGLALMNDGSFWVSDEYGPHMVHYDATGKEIGRINPFASDVRNTYSLPAEFSYRRANRGMEGLTITPDQKTLVGIMQSAMALPNSAAQKSNLTRIVTVSLVDGKVSQYLYKQEKSENSNSEIVALSNDTFLIIERDGSFYKNTSTGQKNVYKITLSSGTNIEELALGTGMAQDVNLGLTIAGKTLEETVTDSSGDWDTLAINGVYPVAKSLVLDMVKETQYPHDKMEGLIVFNDSTLGIINDDDFATWSTDGVLEQKYLNDAKTKIDGNTLYVMKNLNLSAEDDSRVLTPLKKVGVYNTNTEAGSEIVAYDKTSKRVFTTNGAENKVDIINIEDVENPTLVSQIDLSSYGTGVNSVAAHEGKIAVAVEVKSTDGLHTSLNGKVVFFDTDGVFQRSVTVGYLPDMLTFTEDGSKVVVANEGEPNGDYSIDPIGSVGVVTVADGSYVDINFTGATLSDATDMTPVRLGETPSADQAKDIEPEYIAISDNYAYVTLQENNAMAKVNLTTNALEYVKSYGAKSWESDSNNTIDIEEEDAILMKSYSGLFGLYMPDTIATYKANGSTYLVTANEGDGREYPIDDVNASLETGDILTDEKKIKKLDLDASIEAEYDNENDLKVVIDMGDTDNDGKYEKLYSYGARSFSIWDTDGDIVFDSGDEIEKKIALYEPLLFNQDEGEIDGRSGNKGGEPEALTVGSVNGKTLAFVGLERQNVIVIYDISVPSESKFLAYVKTGEQGDVSAEGMKFVPADESPNGKNLLLVSFEVSGSTVVYEIKDL